MSQKKRNNVQSVFLLVKNVIIINIKFSQSLLLHFGVHVTYSRILLGVVVAIGSEIAGSKATLLGLGLMPLASEHMTALLFLLLSWLLESVVGIVIDVIVVIHRVLRIQILRFLVANHVLSEC